MMYIAFTQIWPQSIMQSVKKKITLIEEKLQKTQKAEGEEAIVYAADLAATLEETNYEFSLVQLEPKRLRPDTATLQEFQQRLTAFEQHFQQLALDSTAPS